jgi:transcriptional regulator with GAF, ATPase, and Fis domain
MRRTALDPERILKALIKAKGNRSHAAKAMGVDRTTLIRACHSLQLWDRIDRELVAKGLPTYPRPS